MKFSVATRLLDRMRLWQKFLLLGAFAVAAVLFPFYRYVTGAESDVAFARDEQAGLPATSALLRLIHATQQHRALAANMLAGGEGAAQARAAKEAEVNAAMGETERLLASDTFSPMKDEWSLVRRDWSRIAGSVADRSADMRSTLDAHTALIARMLLALERVADLSKLSLDPEAHTYYLVQAATVHLPRVAEDVSQARSLAVGRFSDTARGRTSADGAAGISDAERVHINNILQALASHSEDSFRFLAKAVNAEPRLKQSIEAEAAAPRENLRRLEQLARKELLEARTTTLDANAYDQAFAAGLETQSNLVAKVTETLNQEIELIVSNKRRAELVISLQILAALLVAGFVAALTVLNIRNTVKGLQQSVEQVRAGDETALQQIESSDEVGDLGRTVNDLLADRLAAQRKAEEENDRLNSSVISLLQAVHQLSQRDLTSRAPVTSDVIGTVSDSINALAEETSRVLRSVTNIAGQVAEASGNVRSQAELVSRTAEDERVSVEQMVGSLAAATDTMNRVTALAEQSNTSAAQATHATDTALETVNGTVKGMEAIRETIAETEKRIKRLGERSQEISGIVNLINTISERTHVLALNASMQAAVAGEAGRGFAVVAEEVQRLAESSRNATQQIATLVNNIQLETNETISTVNRTIGQVVEGSGLAQKAGEQMRRTQEITNQLVAQVKRIGDASEEQRATSANLLAAARRIGESTERTGQQIVTQNRETETLLDSARRLLESVNVFKLPQSA